MSSGAFERLAGTLATGVGIGGLAYSVSFVIVLRSAPTSAALAGALFLLVGGFLSTAVLIALYGRLRETDPGFALWGLVLGLVGAVGSAIHGGYDLANIVKPLPGGHGLLPNAVDPRGVLTFGASALALLIVAWLILRGGALPRGLGHLGYLTGVLLLVIYLGRLIILNPKNPVLLSAALLAGFVANPAWYLWLGRELRRGRAPADATLVPPPRS